MTAIACFRSVWGFVLTCLYFLHPVAATQTIWTVAQLTKLKPFCIHNTQNYTTRIQFHLHPNFSKPASPAIFACSAFTTTYQFITIPHLPPYDRPVVSQYFGHTKPTRNQCNALIQNGQTPDGRKLRPWFSQFGLSLLAHSIPYRPLLTTWVPEKTRDIGFAELVAWKQTELNSITTPSSFFSEFLEEYPWEVNVTDFVLQQLPDAPFLEAILQTNYDSAAFPLQCPPPVECTSGAPLIVTSSSSTQPPPIPYYENCLASADAIFCPQSAIRIQPFKSQLPCTDTVYLIKLYFASEFNFNPASPASLNVSTDLAAFLASAPEGSSTAIYASFMQRSA